MSINLENVKTWTTALREPGRQQVQGTLTVLDLGVRRDCCLGVGCQVAEVSSVLGHARVGGLPALAYGEAGTQGMPPAEFHLWLGTVESANERDSRGNLQVDTGRDVFIDFPHHLESQDGGYITGYRALGCSSMNDDWHLTFPQIADMIDYFGVLTFVEVYP